MLALPELPHSPEIERAALGCLLLGDLIDDATLGDRMGDSLREEDFHDGRHVAAFRAVCELRKAERRVDLLSLIERLKATNQLDEAGGIPYVSSLGDEIPVGYRASEYVETLRDYAGRRRLADFGQQVAMRAVRESVPAVSQVAEATSALGRIEEATCRLGGEFEPIASTMAKVPDHLSRDWGSTLGLPFGLQYLDELTLGFCPGQAVVIAGRPGDGKSAAALHFVMQQTARGAARGAVVSLEMSADEWGHRMLAHSSKVPNDSIRANKLTKFDRERVLNAAKEMADYNAVAIDDRPGNTAADIAARARRLKVASGLDYLVVDYLQIMAGTGRSENRQIEVAENMRAMKRLARELEIPVLVLSQLNRKAEEGNRRPRLSDLRESGAIEQDADIVLMLHHPEPSNWRLTEIIVAKNRSGSVGHVECHLDGATFRFSEIDRKHEVEGGPI